MLKRGQVTLFLLVTIILLVLVGIFVNLNKANVPVEQAILDDEPIALFVQECLKAATEQSIDSLSLQGGYYEPPNAVTGFYVKVPYYFSETGENVPSKETIEREYGKFISEHFLRCLDDFSVLRDRGYDFQTGNGTITVSLDKKIWVYISYPIVAQLGASETYLKDFTYNTVFDFERMYSVITAFAREQGVERSFVPSGYLSVLADQNDFKFSITHEEQDTVVYSLKFSDVLKTNKTVIFNFAAQYDWSGLGEQEYD